MQQLGLAEVQGENEKMIEEFLKTYPNLSALRIKKQRVCLAKVSKDLGRRFDSVTQDELRAYVERLNARSDYSDWTKLDYRLFIKRLFRWLHDSEFVSWIKRGTIWGKVRVDDLLSDSELQAMRRACRNLRDRALLETAYEGAFRPHELLGLKKSSVLFDEFGAIISVEKGKTGPRRVRVINAAPLLADWIANHPWKQKHAPLWIDISHVSSRRSLSRIGLSKILERAARRSGVKKRVNPYIFRHTRLTHLSKVLTESVLCEFAGWKQGSEMPRNYVHLSGRDVDEAILRAYGLKPRERFRPSVAKKCVRCTTPNPNDAEICYRCGFALDDKSVFRRDDEFQKLKREVERMKIELGKLV